MKTTVFATMALVGVALSSPSMAQRGPQGPVTRDAYLATQKERFAAMDANKDGIVTKDELTAQMAERMGETPPPERVDMMFKMIDTDGDGKATATEAEAGAGVRFTTLDADHDGILTPEERRAGMGGMGGRQ